MNEKFKFLVADKWKPRTRLYFWIGYVRSTLEQQIVKELQNVKLSGSFASWKLF